MDYLFQLLDTDNSVGQSTWQQFEVDYHDTTVNLIDGKIRDCDLQEPLRKCNKQTDLWSVKVKRSSQTKFRYIYISRNQCTHVSLKI